MSFVVQAHNFIISNGRILETHKKPWRYRQSLKNINVEEPIDLWLHRPIAFVLVQPFENRFSHIKPVHLTAASAVAGIFGGLCCVASVSQGSHWFLIAGLMLFVSVVLDCADGMLARLRGVGSRFGRLLDAFADQIAGISFWLGMSYAMTFGWEAWWVWPANVVILVSIMFRVGIYDQFKEFYLSHTESGSIATSSEIGYQAGRFERWMYAYYKQGYPRIFELVGGGGRAAGNLSPAQFEKEFRKSIRLISYLGLGTHLFVIYIIALLSVWLHEYTFLITQIIVTGLMNIWCIVSLWHWRRTDRNIMKRGKGQSRTSQ
ncbi:MAG: CDP-alcohol phosphatidyltransferase family protein [Alphaproteobacteria bacterium]|nr:CDP-alcohol phosphatidyltransferase family protein [Alphaproteobacteria bacterium]